MIRTAIEQLETIRRRHKEGRLIAQGPRRICIRNLKIAAPKSYLFVHTLRSKAAIRRPSR